jgi:hypothetical protein
MLVEEIREELLPVAGVTRRAFQRETSTEQAHSGWNTPIETPPKAASPWLTASNR